MLALSNIPSLIVAISILYYRDDEAFEILIDKFRWPIIHKVIGKVVTNWTGNVYGAFKLPLMDKLYYKWDLRIAKAKNQQSIIIGITSRDSENNPDQFWYSMRGDGQVWDHDYNVKTGVAFDSKDIVSLYLDLKHQQIRLGVNDKKEKVIFENITKSNDFKFELHVSLGDTTDCVEMMNFEMK